MIGKNNIGSVGAYAIIGIEYPAGSIATVTQNNWSQIAKNTSGHSLFYLPSNGTYNCSITNGKDTASKNVTITTKEQCEKINLSYGTILYEKGNYYTNITGGWGNSTFANLSTGSCTRNSDNISLTCVSDTARGASFYTENAIDIGAFSKLSITVTNVIHYGTGYCGIGLFSTASISSKEPNYYYSVRSNTSSEQEYLFDISSLAGSYWIVVVMNSQGNQGNCNMVFNRIRLIK